MAAAAMPSPPPPAQRSPVWLVTLADLVALMLTFFVLIFSMSTIERDRWNLVVQGLPAGSPDIVPADDDMPRADSNVATADPLLGIDIGYLDSVLREQLPRDPVLAQAALGRLPDALIVSLPAHLLFDTGSDEIQETARPALFRLGGLLQNLRNEVGVIGHTDPQPISTERFPSNWELSLARAVSVVQALKQSGYSRDVTALGAADGRFADISAAFDEERRRALGRRVDLIIRDTKGH